MEFDLNRTSPLKLFLLLCSVLSGALFAVVWRNYELAVYRINSLHTPLDRSRTRSGWTQQLDNRMQKLSTYQHWLLHSKGLQSVSIPHEELSYGANRTQIFTEADFLFSQVKVLCLVLASSKLRSQAVLHTWTKHCNQVKFFASFADADNKKLVQVKLLDESLLSARTFCSIFVQLLAQQKEPFDWLLITTDHTFAILENLRYMLAPVNSSQLFYFGRPVHHYFLGIYNAYDSGIVLSQAAVNLLSKNVFPNQNNCLAIHTNGAIYSGNFDAFLGMQLAKYDCYAANTLDCSQTRGPGSTRFHPFLPEKHLVPELISVFDSYWSSNVLPIKAGFECCSHQAITFTGFSPVTIYFIDYLLYHLAAFTERDGIKGIGNRQPPFQSYQVPSDVDHHLPVRKDNQKPAKKAQNEKETLH